MPSTIDTVPTGTEDTCLTCPIVNEYVHLASDFTSNLSQTLLGPMWSLFVALAGFWIVMAGFRLLLGFANVVEVGREFLFVMVAASLMAGQGPDLVNDVYSASLGTMGAAAKVGLTVGEQPLPAGDSTALGAGMVELVGTAEKEIMKVVNLGWRIAGAWSLSTPMMAVYGLILVVPYFLLWIIYFAQIVISIFRVMMLAALSPFIMLGAGFSWGREMWKTGVRTMISAFVVLFASTCVIGVMLYGLKELSIGEMATTAQIRELADIFNPKFLTAVALGWLGTAFLFEATGIANSLTQSQFTNAAAATVAGGASMTALALGGVLRRAPGLRALGRGAGFLLDRGSSVAAIEAGRLAARAPGATRAVDGVEWTVRKGKDLIRKVAETRGW